MSSLRNAVKRVTHKERAQPRARSHLGILEKKKDYRVRAKDYHRKEDRINAMREKASMRNPDEFYFGMHNAQIIQDDRGGGGGGGGSHRRTQEAKQKEFEEKVGLETIRIMKDQDLAYVRMQKQRDAKKVERMRSSLQYLDAHLLQGLSNKKRKHTVFVDSKEEAEEFDVAKHFDTIPELAGRAFNRPRVETLRKTALQAVGYEQGVCFEDEHDNNNNNISGHQPTQNDLAMQAKQARKTAKKIAKARSSAYGEMEARVKRMKAMELAEAHLVTEKLVASKGRKRKIKASEDGRPAQYKWRRKRLG